MVRRQCICGGPLRGLHRRDPLMFGFIPSSSLAHYNYDCEFETGVTLPGGRILEQCQQCGALVLCEYPTLDGSLRGDDPLITYGPGTVYEQCDIASVPVTYRSFRALMSSGVTGGIMYSGAFCTNLAELFKTSEDKLPSWKVVKDTLLATENNFIDEWWFASIGRNFIVLYENSKVLLPVSAWHRIPGTEIKNTHIEKINKQNTDPLRHKASDTTEMRVSDKQLDIPDERRTALQIGNAARLRLIQSSIRVGKSLQELPVWASDSALEEGNQLVSSGAVHQLIDTAFGIRHAIVVASGHEEHIDLLMRHDLLAKVTCTCEEAQQKRICSHIVAMVLEIARRYSFRIAKLDIDSLAKRGAKTMQAPETPDGRYSHYGDVSSLIREHGQQSDSSWMTAYIEPFSNPVKPLYHIEFMDSLPAGIPNIGYCVYNEIVLSFIDLMLTRGDTNYLQILRKYGLDKDVCLDILNIDSMDTTLIRALVSMIVNRERRNEGYLAECLENGILVRLLQRLRTLEQA